MIVFISNFLNHHQYPVAEQLYELTGGKYRFVELEPMPESFRKSGYPSYDDCPFLVQAWRSPESKAIADNLMLEADAVIYGNISDYSLIRKRLSRNKLTFECGERWLKRGWINLFSPRLLRSQLYYHLYFHNKPLYRLNASAYAANDLATLRSFKNRMFKWGYFTKIATTEKINLEAPRGVSRLKILFVARFLILKHPELPVLMAEKLKAKGYDFEINMYGSGPELNATRSLIERCGVGDVVNLCGNRPNEEILAEMRAHDVFLFTSDRHEGWGAVVNEAMGSGCAVVASDAVGSVPFLIKDGVNGMIFKSEDVDDMTAKVEFLLNNREVCHKIGVEAHKTMAEVWSPENAAKSLMKLVDSLLSASDNCPAEGPCSPALPV